MILYQSISSTKMPLLKMKESSMKKKRELKMTLKLKLFFIRQALQGKSVLTKMKLEMVAMLKGQRFMVKGPVGMTK